MRIIFDVFFSLYLINLSFLAFSSEEVGTIKQNMYEQCVEDICGTERVNIWDMLDDIHEEAKTVEIPEDIKRQVEAQFDLTLNYLRSLQALLNEEVEDYDLGLTKRQKKAIRIRLILITMTESFTETSRGVAIDPYKLQAAFKGTPKLAEAAFIISSYPVFSKMINFLSGFQKDGASFIDRFFVDGREKGIITLKNMLLKSSESLNGLGFSNVSSRIYSILHGSQINSEDLSELVSSALRFEILSNAVSDEKLDYLSQVKLETIYEDILQRGAKENLNIFLRKQNFVELKAKVIEDAFKKIRTFIASRPSDIEISRFNSYSKNSITHAKSTVKKYLASYLPLDDMRKLLNNIEFSIPLSKNKAFITIRNNLVFEKESLMDKINSSMARSVAPIEGYIFDSEDIDSVFDTALGLDEIGVEFGPKEMSMRYGPVIQVGWQSLKYPKTMSMVLVHEIAHKVEFVLLKNKNNRNFALKYKTLNECISRIHQTNQPADEFSLAGVKISGGHYFSEDFADKFAGLASPASRPNLACAFLSKNSDIEPEDLEWPPLNLDTHSTYFARAINISQTTGILPQSCRTYLDLYHPNHMLDELNKCLQEPEYIKKPKAK